MINPQSKGFKVFEFSLVLTIAYLQLFFASLSQLVFGFSAKDMVVNFDLQIFSMVLYEILALLVLYYVLARQGNDHRFLTENFKPSDIWHSIALAAGSYLTYYLLYLAIYYGYWFVTKQVLAPPEKNLYLTKGLTAAMALLVLVNPVFEEVIGRAYLITQLRKFNVSGAAAVTFCVLLQTFIHFYQGVESALALSGGFLLYSVYYLKTRRLVPIILGHFYIDILPFLIGLK